MKHDYKKDRERLEKMLDERMENLFRLPKQIEDTYDKEVWDSWNKRDYQ